MHIVVIGGGPAGVSAIESICDYREINNLEIDVTLISDEPYLPYYRMKLSKHINEDFSPEDMYICPKEWYEKRNIRMIIGKRAVGMDVKNKEVILEDGSTVGYDRLIVTTGGRSFVPPLEGADLEGVLILRNMKDAFKIKDYIKDREHGIVVGAGPLGLELAWEFIRAGKKITLIDSNVRLLQKQIDEKASEILLRHVENSGARVIFGQSVSKILGEKFAEGVELKNGDTLKGEFVILSAGMRSNTEIFKGTEAKINRGVIVDEYMNTGIEDVYAAGDVAEFSGKVYGLMAVAVDQGRVAGLNACGEKKEYEPRIPALFLNVFKTRLYSIGSLEEKDGRRVFSYYDKEKEIYKKILLEDDFIVGGILLGDISEMIKLEKGINSREKISLTNMNF